MQSRNADLWCEKCLAAPWAETKLDADDHVQAALLSYAETMGILRVKNVLADNLGRWCRTLTGYLQVKCSELPVQKENRNKTGGRELGDAPTVVLKKILKPRGGDLRQLVLPVGGDLCLRMWAGMRRYTAALIGWYKKGRMSTPAFHYHFVPQDPAQPACLEYAGRKEEAADEL